MKTVDLIAMLASGPDVAVAAPPARAAVLPLTGAGSLAVWRRSVPGARTAMLPWWLAAPVAGIWCMAGWALLAAAPGERADLLWALPGAIARCLSRCWPPCCG